MYYLSLSFSDLWFGGKRGAEGGKKRRRWRLGVEVCAAGAERCSTSSEGSSCVYFTSSSVNTILSAVCLLSWTDYPQTFS